MSSKTVAPKIEHQGNCTTLSFEDGRYIRIFSHRQSTEISIGSNGNPYSGNSVSFNSDAFKTYNIEKQIGECDK